MSYKEAEENINSTDSDSDYSDSLTIEEKEAKRKANTYFGVEIKK
jgi:hypothetical protein